MNKRIFRHTFLVSLLTLIASVALVFAVLFGYFENQLKQELQTETEYISAALENYDTEYLSTLDNDRRITLIDPDGVVIFDNAANTETLENHFDREEVKQALENGTGSSVRYSDTLLERIIYYAVRLENGEILRISTQQYTVFTVLYGLLQPVLIIIAAVLVLSIILSESAAKKIVAPINSLDLENPENNDVYDELSPLLKRISEHKTTIEKQLEIAAQKQSEFRLITENMSEGFLVIDDKSRVLSYNSAALKLLGIAEINDEKILEINRANPFRSAVERSLSGKRAENEMQFGEYIYSIISNPVFNCDSVIGAVIVILDITETARREQLRREFTANVSHELKTPLTSISGFAEMMMSGDTSADTVRDFSRSIYDEAQRLISLVGDIIKLSELDENSFNSKRDKVDIFALSVEVTKRLKPLAEKKDIAINIIGKNAEIVGVRKILDEMIYNLIDNAIKYNRENGSVDVSILSENNTVILTVKDTGIGIPRSAQSRVFERFYRVDKARCKATGGTGLGLAIVKHGALLHGAEISLQSEEGRGTSVSVIFGGNNA